MGRPESTVDIVTSVLENVNEPEGVVAGEFGNVSSTGDWSLA